MVALPTVSRTRLTGRTRHRSSLFGKMILQVEEAVHRIQLRSIGPGDDCGVVRKYWRDATFEECYEMEHKEAT